MKITNLPPAFEKAKPVLATIEQGGYEAYFVGGCVRDTLLGIPLHDVDIASSAYPAEIKQLFKHTVDTGIEHGTVMVLDHGTGYEVTTFRTESAYQDFRRPDHVEFVRSLGEDLKRRDLTINALAMRLDGTVVDHFDGLTDLKHGIIRAVGEPAERFHEDALRMMRAVRFDSQLDFRMDPATFAAIKENAPLLEKIAVERIHVEFIKLLLGKNPRQGIDQFTQAELYRYCPGMAQARPALERLAQLPAIDLPDENAAWTLLTAVMGLNEKQTAKFLRQWKCANDTIAAVSAARMALTKLQATGGDAWTAYTVGRSALERAKVVAGLLGIAVPEDLLAQYDALPIKDKHELRLTGQDLMNELGVRPGPAFGRVLAQAERRVVAGELPNDHAALIAFAQTVLKEMSD